MMIFQLNNCKTRESLDDCCCTCRILNYNNGQYTATNDFFTINLNCVSAIKCYSDINLAL